MWYKKPYIHMNKYNIFNDGFKWRILINTHQIIHTYTSTTFSPQNNMHHLFQYLIYIHTYTTIKFSILHTHIYTNFEILTYTTTHQFHSLTYTKYIILFSLTYIYKVCSLTETETPYFFLLLAYFTFKQLTHTWLDFFFLSLTLTYRQKHNIQFAWNPKFWSELSWKWKKTQWHR